MTTTTAKSITPVVDRSTGRPVIEFEAHYEGELIGVYSDRLEAQVALDNHAHRLLTQAAPVVEADPAVVLADRVQAIAADLAMAAQLAGDRAALNAINKAALHLACDATYTRVGGALLIGSGTRPGVVHRVWHLGDVWYCSCEAGQAGRECWHACAAQCLSLANEPAPQALAA